MYNLVVYEGNRTDKHSRSLLLDAKLLVSFSVPLGALRRAIPFLLASPTVLQLRAFPGGRAATCCAAEVSSYPRDLPRQLLSKFLVVVVVVVVVAVTAVIAGESLEEIPHLVVPIWPRLLSPRNEMPLPGIKVEGENANVEVVRRRSLRDEDALLPKCLSDAL